MAKVRVYELAKELSMDSKELVDKLKAGGIPVKNYMSTLDEQVVAKARLTLMGPASTDKTVHMANIPWMFSALPGDHLLAPVLGQALLEEGGAQPKDYEARISWDEVVPDASKPDWYYVRVTQDNGQLAWSSPVWIG